jgi:hypothetical protein
MLKEITNDIFKMHNDKYYNLLFVFARESIEVNNIQETKSVLDEMEKLPISIIVICLGQNDFSQMNILKNFSKKFEFIELKNDKGRYLGGRLPYDSKYRDEAFEIATKAVEAMNGIKGFVGVDMLINADENDVYSVYLLEINSRFTTPYVGLTKVSNINIGKSIIELIDGKINIDDIDISLDGEVEFKKSGESLVIRRL